MARVFMRPNADTQLIDKDLHMRTLEFSQTSASDYENKKTLCFVCFIKYQANIVKTMF